MRHIADMGKLAASTQRHAKHGEYERHGHGHACDPEEMQYTSTARQNLKAPPVYNTRTKFAQSPM